MGRKLIEGAECVKLFGENVEVNARICALEGISGHADKNGLLNWLSAFETPIRHVFVVHGEAQDSEEICGKTCQNPGKSDIWPCGIRGEEAA